MIGGENKVSSIECVQHGLDQAWAIIQDSVKLSTRFNSTVAPLGPNQFVVFSNVKDERGDSGRILKQSYVYDAELN